MIFNQPVITRTLLEQNRREIAASPGTGTLQRASEVHYNHQMREEAENRASGAIPSFNIIRRGRKTLFTCPIRDYLKVGFKFS